MRRMTFVLDVVTESLARGQHVIPEFDEDPRFDQSWWHSGSAKTPVSYCRFLDDGDEVGRAKILPGAGTYVGYTTWSCPPGGATEIDLIEIRADRRGKNYGRQAVEAIGREYGEPVVAMSLNEKSDLFWLSLPWTAHSHPDGGRLYRTLFTSV